MTLLLFYLAVAIGISFVCSVLEAVLLSVTPSHVQQTLEKQPKGGKQLARVKESLDESLSSILILNTFAHTMGAAGVGSQAMQVFGPDWETWIAFFLTLVILYFSEIIPKTLGATFWRQLAVPAAYTIRWLVIGTYPFVWLATRLTKLFSKNKEKGVTPEEIIALASIGHQDGTIINQENEYLTNLLKLRETRTEDILTPRTVVHMLNAETSIEAALDDDGTQHFSRIPVYVDSADDVIGLVTRIELFDADRIGEGKSTIRNLAKPMFRVSEKLPVHSLLDQFLKQKAHLFLVEDEFGQTAGVVSLEDAIETLLGREIVDENDTVEDMQAHAKSLYRTRLKNQKVSKED